MRKGIISHRRSEMHYSITGSGARQVLAFHGYGQDHKTFSRYFDVLGDDCTLYSFDLFFFGQSAWYGGSPISMECWEQLMSAFFQKERISSFELLGFSLGARIALATAYLFPGHLRKLTLIAPDGMVVDPWYRFATVNRYTRSMFRFALRHPAALLVPLRLMKSFGVIGSQDFRFIARQLDTVQARQKVYDVWNLYRSIKVRPVLVGRLLSEAEIPVLIFVGQKDKIIRRSRVSPFRRFVTHARIVELNCGHGSMIRSAAQWIGSNGY